MPGSISWGYSTSWSIRERDAACRATQSSGGGREMVQPATAPDRNRRGARLHLDWGHQGTARTGLAFADKWPWSTYGGCSCSPHRWNNWGSTGASALERWPMTAFQVLGYGANPETNT